MFGKPKKNRTLELAFTCTIGFKATVLPRYQRKKKYLDICVNSCHVVLVNDVAILVKFL